MPRIKATGDEEYKKTSKADWSTIKKSLRKLDAPKLVKLIGTLYKLTSENRNFLHAHCLQNNVSIEAYKKIIYSCMWPERDGQWFEYRKAQKAISDYKKASGDTIGEIELMLHYVETGNRFTVEWGDIDERFYDNVISMCYKAAKKIMTLPETKQEEYRDRLEHLADSSGNIGWGYHEELVEIFLETFPDG